MVTLDPEHLRHLFGDHLTKLQQNGLSVRWYDRQKSSNSVLQARVLDIAFERTCRAAASGYSWRRVSRGPGLLKTYDAAALLFASQPYTAGLKDLLKLMTLEVCNTCDMSAPMTLHHSGSKS